MDNRVPGLDPIEGMPVGGLDLGSPVLLRLREFTTQVAQTGSQALLAFALGRDGQQVLVTGVAPGGNIQLLGLALQGILMMATGGIQGQLADLNRAVVEIVDRIEDRSRSERSDGSSLDGGFLDDQSSSEAV